MNVQSWVENELEKGGKVLGSTKELQIRFLEANGIYLTQIQKEKFRNIPQLDRITRARRALKEDYPYPKEVEKVNIEEFREARHSNGRSVVEMPVFEGTRDQLNQLTII